MSDGPYFQSDDPLDTPPARQPSKAIWLFIGLALVLLGVLLFVPRNNTREREATRHPAVGKSPERWHLEPLTGDPPVIDLAALQGKVTLVNFWGTWCPPCQVEFPHIVALWKELQDQPDFQLAAVSCDQGVEKDIDALRERTEKFLSRSSTEMPTYYDPQGLSRIATMNMAEELVFPTTILFDRQGKVAAYWLGYLPGMEDEVRSVTVATLKKR